MQMIDEKMKAAADIIIEQMMAGNPVSKQDRVFLAAFLAIHSKSAGNAGIRKQTKTGK